MRITGELLEKTKLQKQTSTSNILNITHKVL